MKNFKLIQMSFDGDYVTDSEHETIEQAQETSANLGSKWYFYPWTIIVKGQTVVETGGSTCFIKTGEPVLSSLLKGKRFRTVQNIFKKTYGKSEQAQGIDAEQFENLLIESI